jgi:hypothetical protein
MTPTTSCAPMASQHPQIVSHASERARGRRRRSPRRTRGWREGVKKAPASLPGLHMVLKSLRVRPPRRSKFYPKAHITQMLSKKCQSVCKKKQVKPSLIQKMQVDQITQLRSCDFGGCSSFELRRKKKQNVWICCRSVTAARDNRTARLYQR